MTVDFNTVKKMIAFCNELCDKNYSVDDLSEENLKSVYRTLSKKYHSDLHTSDTVEERRRLLQEALKVFPDLVYKDDFETNFNEVTKKLNAVFEFNKSKNGKNPEKVEYEFKRTTCKGLDEQIEQMLGENPELEGILSKFYNKALSLNSEINMENIKRILDFKSAYKARCSIIVEMKKNLDNFNLKIKELTDYDLEKQEESLLRLKDILTSFLKKINQLQNLPEDNDISSIYFEAYRKVNLLIAPLVIDKEIHENISRSRLGTLNDYSRIRNYFEWDLGDIKLKRSFTSGDDDMIDSIFTNLIAEYKVMIDCTTRGLSYCKELEDKIGKEGFTVLEVGVDLEQLLFFSNIDSLNRCKLKVSDDVDFNLIKLKVIRDIRNKASRLPDNVVPNDIEKVIDNINNFRIVDDKTAGEKQIYVIANPILNRLDYSLYVNMFIDEYLEKIKNNPKYSFSYGDIKAELDKKRGYYFPLDVEYRRFMTDFRVDKDKFKEKAINDYEKGNQKKKDLYRKISGWVQDEIFLFSSADELIKKVDSVKSFGEFAKTANGDFSKIETDIINSEFLRQKSLLEVKLSSSLRQINDRISKEKKGIKPRVEVFVSISDMDNDLIKEYENRKRCIIKAIKCCDTLSKMFENSSGNFNNMVIQPELRNFNTQKNAEDFKKAFKQMIELISLDYESDSLERIDSVVDKVYDELLFDELGLENLFKNDKNRKGRR